MSERITPDEAISRLDGINGDPEGAHCAADDILLAVVPSDVEAAYDRLVTRTGSWWFA